MKLGLLLILIAITVTACSRRVAYSTNSGIRASADAININTATEIELEGLPHVGKKTAEAIVEFREQNGSFRRVEQVMLVRGLSERRFVELRPFIRAE